MRLINDILDIDKIASGNMRFNVQEHPLAHIVQKVLSNLLSNAAKFSPANEVVSITARTQEQRADERDDVLGRIPQNRRRTILRYQ